MKNIEAIVKKDGEILGDVEKIRFYPLVAERGVRNTIFDVEGNEYLDFTAGWAVVNTGYCHPKITESIIAEVSKLNFSPLVSVLSESSIELGEKLTKLMPGAFEKKVWFGLSGSDANDCIAKVVPMAKKRPRLISFVGSYHGQTLGAYSLSGHPAQTAFIGAGNVTKVPYPFCYRCPFKKNKENCNLFCLDYLEEYIFDTICPPGETAGIIVEAIQSDGGDVVPPNGFLQRLQEICRKHDIYLILDEVKIGMGRTGKFFGFENWDIVPDAIVLGKPIASGLPLSAVIAKKEILDCAVGIHLFTMGGHPISCSAGIKTIEIIQQEKLIENAKVVGEYLAKSLLALKEKYEIIGDVRGKGLIVGAEFVKDRATKEPAQKLTALITYRAFELGLLVFYAGVYSNVIEITPPLTLTRNEVDKGVGILEQAIEDVLNNKVDEKKLSQFVGW